MMKSKLLLMTFAITIAITLQLKAQTPGWGLLNTGFPKLPVDSTYGIFNMSIPDSNTVWASNLDGATGSTTVHLCWTRTVDGGQTFTGGTISDAQGLATSNIFASDANTAFYMFWNPSHLAPAVYKTTDGGSTWNQVPNVYPGNAEFPDWGTFFDSQNGVMLGDPVPSNGNIFHVYTTSDAGATWTPVSSNNLPAPIITLTDEEGGLNGQTFSKAGNSVWCGTTDGRVLRSTDMGHTWKAFTIPGFGTFGAFVVSIGAKDSNTCVVDLTTQPPGTIVDLGVWETTDGGATWNNVVTAGGNIGDLSSYSSFASIPGTDSLWVVTGAAFATGTPGGSVGSLFTKDFVNVTQIDTSVQHTVTIFTSPTRGYSGFFQFNVPDTLVGGGMFLFNPNVTAVQSPVFDANTMKLYPNPAKDYFTFNVRMWKPSNLQVSLMNSLGQVVSTFVNPQAYGMVVHNFNTQNLARGLYFLQVKVGKSQSTQKVIIQ